MKGGGRDLRLLLLFVASSSPEFVCKLFPLFFHRALQRRILDTSSVRELVVIPFCRVLSLLSPFQELNRFPPSLSPL